MVYTVESTVVPKRMKLNIDELTKSARKVENHTIITDNLGEKSPSGEESVAVIDERN